jgi:hypothetical protein
MINEEILGGRTKEEFIDFMSDMLMTDNALANNILNEYFNEETPECWNFRTNIIIEWYGKKQKMKNKNGKIYN